MSLSNTFRALLGTVGKDNDFDILVAKVKSVDESSNTIDATPITGGADVLGAKLRVSVGNNSPSLIVYPAIGSFVLIAATAEGDFVIAIDTWESVLITDQTSFECHISGGKMVFNGAENNSDLLILPRLLEELGKVSAFMAALKLSISAAIPVPGDGGLAIKTAIATALANTQELSLSGLGNSKIRH